MTVTVPASNALSTCPRDRDALLACFRDVRGQTDRLTAPLSDEDQVVQSMPDASPAKWHRAHVTWFFETFVLGTHAAGYEVFHEHYTYLFNSYYNAVGDRHPRPQRGMLTRPPAADVSAYRAHVDAAMERFIATAPASVWPEAAPLIVLGLHHEQQHQELILMDILHLFAQNSIDPAYQTYRAAPARRAPPLDWIDYAGGVREIGHAGDTFAFDNEGPRHEVLLRPYRLASRPVTNAEWLDFIADDGYRRPEFWLSDGWAAVEAEGWQAPLYWSLQDGSWTAMSLSGRQTLNLQAPVCHVSYYEADAYARWAGRRLPTEAEWECAAADLPVAGNFAGAGLLRTAPAAGRDDGVPEQMFGDVWEWTQSAYAAYPGFRAAPGAVGEYNGKFMANQMTLRGGSCVTPPGHVRISYRNFFYPDQRWQFTGLRVARDG